MKKAAVIISAAMIICLTACGGSSGGSSVQSSGETVKDTAQSSSAASGDSIVLTYAEVNPADSIDGKLASYYKEQVEKKTNGSVTIDLQLSGVLGAEGDILDGMTTGGGTVDLARISCFALNNFGGKLSSLLSVPYTFESKDHFWKFTESDIGKKVLDEPGELNMGLKGLFFVEEGFRDYFFKDPVSKLEDIKGKKIRVSADPILTETTELLGASPTVISFNELYTSLQSGVVDGADQPISTYASNAFNEVAPYVIEDGHTLSASEVIITEAAYNKLSDDQKKALDEAGKATSEYCRKIENDLEKQSIEDLKGKGVTFAEVKDKQPWIDACQKVIDE
jgi:tripartite ATP-independent transporter DctP family solute receptor